MDKFRAFVEFCRQNYDNNAAVCAAMAEFLGGLSHAEATCVVDLVFPERLFTKLQLDKTLRQAFDQTVDIRTFGDALAKCNNVQNAEFGVYKKCIKELRRLRALGKQHKDASQPPAECERAVQLVVKTLFENFSKPVLEMIYENLVNPMRIKLEFIPLRHYDVAFLKDKEMPMKHHAASASAYEKQLHKYSVERKYSSGVRLFFVKNNAAAYFKNPVGGTADANSSPPPHDFLPQSQQYMLDLTFQDGCCYVHDIVYWCGFYVCNSTYRARREFLAANLQCVPGQVALSESVPFARSDVVLVDWNLRYEFGKRKLIKIQENQPKTMKFESMNESVITVSYDGRRCSFKPNKHSIDSIKKVLAEQPHGAEILFKIACANISKSNKLTLARVNGIFVNGVQVPLIAASASTPAAIKVAA